MGTTTQQPRSLLRRVITRGLMLIYALAAGCLSVWLVSFTPIPGPLLTHFVPPRAGLVLHISGGAEVMNAVAHHPAMQELLSDPDFCIIAQERLSARNRSSAPAEITEPAKPIPQQLTERIEAWESQRGGVVRWAFRKLFPLQLSSLRPFIGQEVLFARITPELDVQAAEPPDPNAAAPQHRRAEGLILTRLSGGRGLLARLALRFSHNSSIYDLGGDVLAIGTNGGKPTLDGSPFVEKPVSAGSESSATEFARLTIQPLVLQGKLAENEDIKDCAKLVKYLEVLAKSVAQSIVRAPGPAEWFGLSETPKLVRVDFFAKDGQVLAYGEIDGGAPALPKELPDPAAEQPAKTKALLAPYLQGVLPVDPKACFLTYINEAVRPVRNEKDPTGKRVLKTRQERWLSTLAHLKRDETHPENLDLDEDLWPAFGHALAFQMEEAPQDLSPTGYGLLRIAAPFNGKRFGARGAFGALLFGQWDLYDSAPGKDAHMPYVRIFDGETEDRYVLATGEVSAPTIKVNEHSISLTSDAGLFALVGNPAESKAAPPTTAPQAYYLRINGPRFAPNVETFETQDYNDTEKRLGTQEFVAKYSNHDAHIAVARKLAGLLGDFYLEVKPTGNGRGELKLMWKPGTVNIPSGRSASSTRPQNPDSPAPAPPPPPDGSETRGVAPPPPAPDNKSAPDVAPPPPPPQD